MAHRWRWLILSGTPDEFRWDITEEASVRRFQLPEVSAAKDIEAAEGSGDVVQALFLDVQISDDVAKLDVHFSKKPGAHHTDFIYDEPSPSQDTLGDIHARLGCRI